MYLFMELKNNVQKILSSIPSQNRILDGYYEMAIMRWLLCHRRKMKIKHKWNGNAETQCYLSNNIMYHILCLHC